MASVDSLPADQQAVLSLLLRRGRTYADIAGMLKISDAAVRERAHGALTAVGPPAGDLSVRRRAEIGDWLLGQGEPDEQAGTEALLGRDERARAWAAGVASELAPLGGDRLPAIPPPAGHAPTPLAAGAGAAAAPAARPRSSRVGGAVLLAFVALVAVIAVVLLTRGGDDESPSRAASTGSTTSANQQTRVVAQVNLKAPDGAPLKKAIGVVQVVRAGKQQAMSVVLDGLPEIKSRRVGYGVWLSSPSGKRQWLGYPSFAPQQGRLVAQAALSTDVTGYRELLITRERGQGPSRPGTIYLRGRVQQAPAQGSG
jgi:hypothetical protein